MKKSESAKNKTGFSFIGVDIGGTFTDAVLLADGELKVLKTLTRPGDPGEGVLELVRRMERAQFVLTHGSTLATNAILERKGEPTAFFATEGFSDMLSIGRQDRRELYNLDQEAPVPLVPEELCYDIPERIDFMGDILTPLKKEAVKEIIQELIEKKIRSLSVCLLFSYKNPDHERDIRAMTDGLPIFVSLSSDVLPEYREYERASTTTLNACVSPILNRYISSLGRQLEDIGCKGFKIMESNGGILPAGEASALGVRTVLSGPAGGVEGAFQLAKAAGEDKIITMDMGGTSTDISLCEGEITKTSHGCIDGFPIALPMVDMVTIGAGGGSIARVDAGGVLKVGPESAGAYPGPAAYGKGELPTVTDAHLVLGTLSPGDFLGGEFQVDSERAYHAVSRIGEVLDLFPDQAAAGIVKIAVSHMERALRVVSLERGRDPALFTLVPFGGAGPLHAPFLAESLGIRKILIPRHPGILSALGMLLCDFRMDFSKSILLPMERMTDELCMQTWEDLYEKAAQYLNRGCFDTTTFEHVFELRYKGQSFEIPIKTGVIHAIKSNDQLVMPQVPSFDFARIAGDFNKEHERLYGFSRNEEPVEFVNIRLEMTGYSEKPQLKEKQPEDESPDDAFIEEREITTLEGKKIKVPVYSREKLKPGNKLPSPCLVTQYDSTVIVTKPWKAMVDGFENIILEK